MRFKDFVDEAEELLVGEGVGEFGEGIGEAAVMPLVIGFILGMEDFPQFVSLRLVVSPDGAHVTEFIAQRHNLGVVRRRSEPVDSRLLAVVPRVLFADTFGELITLCVDEFSYSVSELTADIFDRDIGVFDSVV